MTTDDHIVLNYRLREALAIGAMAAGKVRGILIDALFRQKQAESFWLVVPDLQTLDYCVARGIKPSNIKLPYEFHHNSWWQTAHVAIFDDSRVALPGNLYDKVTRFMQDQTE